DITYIFLNSDMSYSKYKYPNYDKLEAESVRYLYVNVFINVVKSISNINIVLFNFFKQQLSKIECGAFIISFCLDYVIINPCKKTNIKYVYNALLMKGDLMMTYLRSCFFITMEDLNIYKLTVKDYLNSYHIYSIQNKYYLDY